MGLRPGEEETSIPLLVDEEVGEVHLVEEMEEEGEGRRERGGVSARYMYNVGFLTFSNSSFMG